MGKENKKILEETKISWLKHWKEKITKDPVTLFISFIGILLTIIGILLTIIGLWTTITYNNKQIALNARVATFTAQEQATSNAQTQQGLNIQNTQVAVNEQAQGTSDALVQLGLNIQNTQVAMQSEANSWVNNPNVNLETLPIVFLIDQVVSKTSQSVNLISGSGNLNLILFNNGGGKAGFIAVDWLKDNGVSSQIQDLSIPEVRIGNQVDPLPMSIDSQSPLKLSLRLTADVEYPGDLTGKSDYWMGDYLKNELKPDNNHLVLQFANTQIPPVRITDIELTMPVQSFVPDPPSLFSVTNKTELGTISYNVNDQKYSLRITDLNDNQIVNTIVDDNISNSFPVGRYDIEWREIGISENQPINHKIVTVTPDGNITIRLALSTVPAPTSTRLIYYLYTAALFVIIVIFFIIRFFLRLGPGELVFFTEGLGNYDRAIQVHTRPLLPWGFRTKKKIKDFQHNTASIYNFVLNIALIKKYEKMGIGNRKSTYYNLRISQTNPSFFSECDLQEQENSRIFIGSIPIQFREQIEEIEVEFRPQKK